MSATILVVEDDVNILKGIRDVLMRANYNVIIASDGQEGLAALEEAPLPPDLILSDIMMPVMNGYEFIKAVRQDDNWIDIPFVFLTAKTERADVNEGRRLGVDDYLYKPFVPEELLLAVNSKLNRHRQIRDRHTLAVEDLRTKIMTILNHELRTPLTYIIGFNDILKFNADNVTGNELRMLLGRIDSGARRLRSLLENFIMLVELQTDNDSIHINLNELQFDYTNLLKYLIQVYMDVASQEEKNFVVQIADDAPSILSNKEYFIKIIDCLLDNAFKFTKPEGTISLKIQRFNGNKIGDHLCIQVADNGRGIAPADQGQIFEPFFQAVRQNDEHPGTGTGLAIVDGLTKLHKGKIHVKSELGKGSTFTVLLPALED